MCLTISQKIDKIKEIMLNECPFIAIANKQDLCKEDGRMHSKLIEDLLHTRTIGLTAIDPKQRMLLMNTLDIELKKVILRKRLRK